MKVCLLPSTDLLTAPGTHIVHTVFINIFLPILIEGPAHCLCTLGIPPTGNLGFPIVIEPSPNTHKLRLTYLQNAAFKKQRLAKLQFN